MGKDLRPCRGASRRIRLGLPTRQGAQTPGEASVGTRQSASGGTTAEDQRAQVERLTPLDVSNLRVEERGLPMHVAALAVVDAGPLLDAEGRLRLPEIREYVERRTRLAPRLRQVLVRPRRGLGPPFWADDPAFDITRHVRARTVTVPGDEAALLATSAALNEPPLDRGKPLWELWLLTGLAGDRVGLLIRLHHVVADGIAALALFGSLFDLAPDAATVRVPPYRPEPRPSDRGLLAGNLRDRRDAARRVLAALGRPADLAGEAVRRTRRLGAVASQGRAPDVSLNRPVGPHHRLMLARVDLGRTKAVAHEHGAKVNDVVLAAVAGGARRLLEGRGELTPDLVLRVSVAASVRAAHESGGNRVGIRVVPVPVGEPDPVVRLERIAAATAAQRGEPPYQPAGRLLQRWMVRVMSRQRMVNLLLSNLPGPSMPLYFAGALVREMFQLGVVQGNLALAVGALSYAGRLHIDVVADADTFPDLATFTAGVDETFARLGLRDGPPGRDEPGTGVAAHHAQV